VPGVLGDFLGTKEVSFQVISNRFPHSYINTCSCHTHKTKSQKAQVMRQSFYIYYCRFPEPENGCVCVCVCARACARRQRTEAITKTGIDHTLHLKVVVESDEPIRRLFKCVKQNKLDALHNEHFSQNQSAMQTPKISASISECLLQYDCPTAAVKLICQCVCTYLCI